jgi:hypothetical protein
MIRKRTFVYAAGGLVIPGVAVIYGLLPASAAAGAPITGLGGKCVEVAGAATANGTAIQMNIATARPPSSGVCPAVHWSMPVRASAWT